MFLGGWFNHLSRCTADIEHMQPLYGWEKLTQI